MHQAHIVCRWPANLRSSSERQYRYGHPNTTAGSKGGVGRWYWWPPAEYPLDFLTCLSTYLPHLSSVIITGEYHRHHLELLDHKLLSLSAELPPLTPPLLHNFITWSTFAGVVMSPCPTDVSEAERRLTKVIITAFDATATLCLIVSFETLGECRAMVAHAHPRPRLLDHTHLRFSCRLAKLSNRSRECFQRSRFGQKPLHSLAARRCCAS